MKVFNIQGMPLATSDTITVESFVATGEVTSSGTTATVAHTAHGYVVGDLINVTGSSDTDYNGVFPVVTVPNVNTLTYTMLADPADDSADGTMYVSRVIHLPTAYMEAAATRITGTGFSAPAYAALLTVESAGIRFTHGLPGTATYPTPGAAGTGVGHVVAAASSYEMTGENMVNTLYACISLETDTTAYITVTPYLPHSK